MDRQDYLSSLNEEQRKAVQFEGKHLLVLAGAGTGKTRTIISRAMYLMDKGVQPSRIIIVSFTKKSANEIANRIKAQDNKYAGITGQTFHSWCMGIIKKHPNMFECSDATCLDEEDAESAIKIVCGRHFKDKNGVRVLPKTVKEVFSYMINVRCSLSEALRVKLYDNGDMETLRKDIEENKPIFEEVIKKYIRYKKERNYIDYDDILNTVAVGLKKNKEAANFISSKYDHILIDEFQDTNPLQYLLMSAFYGNCHLFCVGDDAQSIYGFRGADFKSMHNFTQVVNDSEVYKLTLNYRSTQQVLDVANWIISQSSIKYDKDLKAFRGNGEKPKIIHVEDDWEEANHITEDILQSVNEKGRKWKEHMVLSRSLFGLRKVESLCIKKKIPYAVFGGNGLMQSKHVRDVVSALRIAANFRDELAWMRYLMLWEGIGEVTAARIMQSLFTMHTLKDCIQMLMSLSLQKEIYETLQKLDGLQENPAKAIASAVDSMDARMKRLYEKESWSWDSRKQDFPLLEEIAMSSSSLTEFISEYVLDPKLESSKKTPGKDLDAVILSTIHSAKGLEAGNVYIVSAGPTNFPTPRAILNGFDAVEEERRCLYVAVTRAKDQLFLYRNINCEHTDNGVIAKTKDYTGTIDVGAVFINKIPRLNTRVTVERIDKDGKIYWKSEEGYMYSLDEWNFRHQYLPESEYQGLLNNSLYFLNDIPNGIIDNVTAQGTSPSEATAYSGEKIAADDLGDLDFS